MHSKRTRRSPATIAIIGFTAAGIVVVVLLGLTGFSIAGASAVSTNLLHFGPSWHLVGNESIGWPLGNRLCGIPPTPCGQYPTFDAQKYESNSGMSADLVQRWIGAQDDKGHAVTYEYNIVVVKNEVYCVSTNSTTADPTISQYFDCPKVISDVSPPFTVNEMYNLTIDDHNSYLIGYNLTNGAKLVAIHTNFTYNALSVVIDSTASGKLTIELPRKLIDSTTPMHTNADCFDRAPNGSRIYNYCGEDTNFNIILDNIFNRTDTTKIGYSIPSDSRLVMIDYPKGTNTIEIQGTVVAPEFGLPVSMLFLFISITTIVITRISLLHRRVPI